LSSLYIERRCDSIVEEHSYNDGSERIPHSTHEVIGWVM
jgi:hypothetical protein